MQESIKKFELSGFIQSTLVQTRSRRWWVFWGTQTVWRFHEFNSDWQASNTNPVLDIYLALKKRCIVVQVLKLEVIKHLNLRRLITYFHQKRVY